MKKTKPIIAAIMLSAILFVSCSKENKSENESQNTTTTAKARAEYIEVEPNVRLHVTDLGEGNPVV